MGYLIMENVLQEKKEKEEQAMEQASVQNGDEVRPKGEHEVRSLNQAVLEGVGLQFLGILEEVCPFSLSIILT